MLFGDVCHFIDLAIWFQQSVAARSACLRHRRSRPRRGKLDHPAALRQWRPQHRAITSAAASRALSARPSIFSAAADRPHLRLPQADAERRTSRPQHIAAPARSRPEGDAASDDGAVFPRARERSTIPIASSSRRRALLAAHRSIRERRVVLMGPNYPYALD